MEFIKLPLSQPLAKGYLHYAYQFSILGCKEETKTWIFMNYIQLISENGNAMYPVNFYLPDYTGYNWSILTPWFDYSVITRDFIIKNDLDFHKIIVDSLMNKQYVYFYLNERYIPGTRANQLNTDFNHMILIHGYHHGSKEAYFTGFDKNRNFTERSVPIEILKQAYFDNTYDYERNECRMFFLKLREDEGFKLYFDMNHFIKQLSCLLHGRKVINNVIDYHTDFTYSYGLNVYDNITKLLELHYDGQVQNQKTDLVIPMHVLMEHKHIMVERLKYVETLFPRVTLDQFVKYYEDLKKSFENLRNLSIKYKISGDRGIIRRIKDRILNLKEEEKSVLTELIDHFGLTP